MTDEQVKREFVYVAAKLDVGGEELQRYLEMPKYSFRDYPSQQGIYSLGAWVLKRLGIEKGGKR